ncbi:MAG: DNA repair protein RecN [Candidatus Latescibacterota bacterium]
MLTRLFVRDFALIEEVEIEFGPGLNVITGETGAGKSILMGALYSILGGVASADLVRDGAERCVVEGVFEFDGGDPTLRRLATLEAEPEDGQLILRREIRANGRSRAAVNGLTVPVRDLAGIGGVLVDLHGQHEHQSLLDTAQHVGFLDAHAGLHPQAQEVATLHRAWRGAERRLQELAREARALVDAEETRLFQLREIRALAPRPGEDEQLERELQIRENAETLVRLCGGLEELLYQGDGSVVEQLGQARRQLERLVQIDLSMEEHGAALEEAMVRVEDLATAVRDYARRVEFQPERTEQVRARLESLRALCRRHGGTLERVLETARQLEKEESRAGRLDDEMHQAGERRDLSLAAFSEACLRLSARRQEAGAELALVVEKGLRELGMPQVSFVVKLLAQEDESGPVGRDGRRWRADERGLEAVEFHLSPNAGEPPRPLARIASGGEISRIMLALKEVIAEKDTVSTLVFDEIDVGISGRIAAAVGRKLRALSGSHQVLVITHLPQIAGMAAQHFSVRKRQSGGRTITEVHRLAEADRAEEIARLLAGETVSETARQHAREMLR